MTQEARTAGSGRKKITTTAAKSDGKAVSGPALHSYNSAVQFLQHGNFDKALAAFEKMLPDAPMELKERCRMYIATCRRQIEKSQLKFETPEEHYDFAVSLLNTGYFEEARDQFSKILSQHPEADYVYYGLAVLEAITGRTQECLNNLAQAIDLNPRNRLQARVDNDFQNIVDDPRFTELLYPEIP
jgi:tetratricopeptide (TPR) repeat protein